MSNVMIETKNLTKTFKMSKVVDGLDLHIPKGEIYGFLGPNGAGKTTTIRMLLGLMKPSSGSVSIFGKDLKKDRLTILRKVGSLVESPSYYGHLSATENLELMRKILDLPKNRINEVLSIVRLEKEANRPVRGFSLGMKQRLGIASSLLAKPELLILDEPTNGLDPSGMIEMRELLISLPKEYGMTVLISSHLLSEIEQMATQVGIISKGNLIFQDSIDKLRKQAKHTVQLKTNNNSLAAKQLLAQGIITQEVEGGLSLHVEEDRQIAHVVKSLVIKNIDIYRVEAKAPSLEKIFLDMTREEQSL